MNRILMSVLVFAALAFGAGGMYTYRSVYPHQPLQAVLDPPATASQMHDAVTELAKSRAAGTQQAKVIWGTVVSGIEQVRKDLAEARQAIQAMEVSVRNDTGLRALNARIEALERWRVQPAHVPRKKPPSWDAAVLFAR